MSNLCMTSYVIEGSKSSIKALHNQFRKVLATDRSEFADQRGTYLPQSSWLGYVVKDILLLEPDKDNVCCRGSILLPNSSIGYIALISVEGRNPIFVCVMLNG